MFALQGRLCNHHLFLNYELIYVTMMLNQEVDLFSSYTDTRQFDTEFINDVRSLSEFLIPFRIFNKNVK